MYLYEIIFKLKTRNEIKYFFYFFCLFFHLIVKIIHNQGGVAFSSLGRAHVRAIHRREVAE